MMNNRDKIVFCAKLLINEHGSTTTKQIHNILNKMGCSVNGITTKQISNNLSRHQKIKSVKKGRRVVEWYL